MEKTENIIELPSTEQVEKEYLKNKYKNKYRKILGSTISILVVVAAIAVLISVFFVPVIQVAGESMSPTLSDGDVLVLIDDNNYSRGDLCCIMWGNKKLLKRIIGMPGEWVSIDSAGNVYINDELLDEPYITEKLLGECDIEFPYQIPDGKVFVLGDNRTTSVDSRNSAIGCVGKDQIMGRMWFKVWPFNKGD